MIIDGKISSPVSLKEISELLGETSKLSSVCTSDKLNLWSPVKPYDPTYGPNNMLQLGHHNNSAYGLDFPRVLFYYLNSGYPDNSQMFKVIKYYDGNLNGWGLNKSMLPKGTVYRYYANIGKYVITNQSPYKLSLFIGYDHTALLQINLFEILYDSIIDGIKCVHVNLEVNNESIRFTILIDETAMSFLTAFGLLAYSSKWGADGVYEFWSPDFAVVISDLNNDSIHISFSDIRFSESGTHEFVFTRDRNWPLSTDIKATPVMWWRGYYYTTIPTVQPIIFRLEPLL